MGIHKITLVISLLLLIACNKNNTQSNSDVYVGAYRSMDRVIPYPFIFHEANDSIALYNNRGSYSIKYYIKE